jgi:hypothetical protein
MTAPRSYLLSVRRYALLSGDVVFVIERTSGTDYVYCKSNGRT